jgi:serine protease Do
VSFAIPIDVASKVAQQLKEYGEVRRGWLGVVVQEVTRDLAKSFGLERPEGALVAQIVPGGPGEQAGLRVGDVILQYEGQDLPKSNTLPPMVGATDPGTTVELKVLRDGKAVKIRVVVGTLQPDQAAGGTAEAEPPRSTRGILGIVVRKLTPEERERAQIVSGGAYVQEVNDGAGRESGLLPGDILLTIGGDEVDGPERLAEVAGRLTPGRSVPMLVQRRGQPTFLALDVPPADE